MRIIIRFLRLFLWILYFISKLIPRKRNIWVFGSWNAKSFSDNPKYLYLYVNQFLKNEIRSIWITKNKDIYEKLKQRGFEVYLKSNIKAVFFTMIAKYWFFGHHTTDIMFWTSGGAVKIDLHHGTPIKKILWDNFNNVQNFRASKLREILSRISLVPWRFQSPDYVLITSEKLRNAFKSAFEVEDKSLLFCGNTRNDILFDNINGYDINMDIDIYELLKDKKFNNKSKILFYMPTFREKGRSPIYDFFEFAKTNEFLEENDIYLIIKEHPWARKIDLDKRLLKRVFFLNRYSDHTPFFKITDILITDYSSVFVDFLILDKPLIFLSYDLNSFVNDSRELYFDYKYNTPGYKVFNIQYLPLIINTIIKKGDFLSGLRKRVLNEFYTVEKKDSCKCVVNFIKNLND